MSKYEKRDSPSVSAQDFPNKIREGVKEEAFEIFHKIFKNKFVKPKRAENAIVLFA